MALRILETGANSDALYFAIGLVAVTVILNLIFQSSKGSQMDNIPTVGSSTWLGSWWSGIAYVFNAHDVIREGYRNYKGRPFKVATFYQWIVIVSGRNHVEDFSKFRDDELSFLLGANETVRAEHTIGYDVFFHPWHIRLLRMGLNKNLLELYPEFCNEILTAFGEILNLKGHEWKSVPAHHLALEVITRASNRVFVGLPLCRHPEWLDINMRFTLDVAKGGLLVSLVPRSIASLVVRLFTDVHQIKKRAIHLLTPIVEERLRLYEENGRSWANHPNDFLTWLLAGTESSKHTPEILAQRVLSVNFAALHTSSNAWTQSLYNLAAYPQYVPILREEVETILREEGWSKSSITKMHKVDSFIKESQRMNGIVFGNMVRVALKDLTFSDGTMVPKGAYMMMATQCMQSDEGNFENPQVFDPFRFANMRSNDDATAGTKYMFSATNFDYLPFGHGRHACPGRFFAGDELVTMFAHFIITYDAKLKENSTRPGNMVFGSYNSANPLARVMIRKRVD